MKGASMQLSKIQAVAIGTPCKTGAETVNEMYFWKLPEGKLALTFNLGDP
jgi:hypothetical protein